MSLKKTIAEIKTGSKKAEKALFLTSTQHLMSVALRYVVDQSAARDVLQESYIRIYNNIEAFQYESENATLAWMRQITAREAIRWIKKQQRWRSTEVQPFAATITEDHPMFEDDLFKFLMALPTDQRLVFNMKAIEGYSHKEIAVKLNIAESSSRSLLTRARKNLAAQLTSNKKYLKTTNNG